MERGSRGGVGGKLQSNPMSVRLLFVQLIKILYMIFYMMDMKLIMIDFQIPRTKKYLQEILTYQYINRDGNVVA